MPKTYPPRQRVVCVARHAPQCDLELHPMYITMRFNSTGRYRGISPLFTPRCKTARRVWMEPHHYPNPGTSLLEDLVEWVHVDLGSVESLVSRRFASLRRSTMGRRGRASRIQRQHHIIVTPVRSQVSGEHPVEDATPSGLDCTRGVSLKPVQGLAYRDESEIQAGSGQRNP